MDLNLTDGQAHQVALYLLDWDDNNGRSERIDVIEKMGHLDRTDAEFLQDAATFYRAIDHGLRVYSGHAEGKLPNSEEHLATLKTAISGSDLDAITSATEALMTSSQGFTQRLYDAAAQADRETSGGPAGASQPSDDDVVDAEIVDEGEQA